MKYGYEDEYGWGYVRQWEREHPVLDFIYSLTALIVFIAIYGIAYGFIIVPPVMFVYCVLKNLMGF